jgi:hypothetical protein
MILETLTTMLLSVATQAPHSQTERCAHNDAKGEMICVNRLGHCMDVSIDGQKTTALADEATAKRVHAIKHDQDVCWQIAQAVSTKLRVEAKAGGIFPSFLGKIEKISVNVYELDAFDPKVDSRLDDINGAEMVADGDPNGTWQLKSERPLKAGEYVIVFRVFGVGNWDKQAVLLTLDPKLQPGPADKAGAGK